MCTGLEFIHHNMLSVVVIACKISHGQYKNIKSSVKAQNKSDKHYMQKSRHYNHRFSMVWLFSLNMIFFLNQISIMEYRFTSDVEREEEDLQEPQSSLRYH